MTIRDEYNEQGREMREHGGAAFPIAHYSGDWSAASVPLHWHDEFEAGYVTAGQVVLCVGPERSTLHEGEGFFINAGIPHAFLHAEEGISRQRSVVFDPSIVGGRFDSVFWQRYVQPVSSAASMPWKRFSDESKWCADAVSAIAHAWNACEAHESAYELEVRHSLSRMFALLAEHLPQEHPAQTRRITRDNERIRVMLQFIQENFAGELTVTDIARSAMVSQSECLRCFRNTLGLTPIQYLKSYRVQRASEQLQSSARKICDIGTDCGFREMSYFAKTFREIIGVTPGEYRKSKQAL